MEMLKNHPYFIHKESERFRTVYSFKKNGEMLHISIKKGQDIRVGWLGKFSSFKQTPEWFQMLYAQTLLALVEKKKIRILLASNPYEVLELTEIYLRAHAILQDKDTSEKEFMDEYITKAKKELGFDLDTASRKIAENCIEGKELK